MMNRIIPFPLLALGLLLAAPTGCGDAPTSPGTANHPPQIFPPALQVSHDTEYRETVTVLDPDGDSLSVQAAALPGQGNPVLIETYGDYPSEIQDTAEVLNGYYLAFELAVHYLLDPEGLGDTPTDVKGLYLAIRAGIPFPAAFDYWMGVSVTDYAAEFWPRMEAYLD